VIGLRLNNYEIISVIGEGGMGTVYLARHTFTGRKAAVKLLHPQLAQDQVLVARFMNEARATAAIGHPNIIDIIDVGFLPDGLRPYLMMELLQGESLGDRLQREHPLPIHEAIEIAGQTAFALSAAHACGIVHRDLKPDNLFLVPDPTMPPLGIRVKVLDFGIAKLRGELSSGSVKTRTGTIMGTPQYMSPEQCRGLAEHIDQRTDIYTLGVIAYEMVCGSPPFVSEGLGDMLVMHLSNPPAPPRTLNPAVPEALEAAIMRALAKDPSQRFASMAEFQEALRPGNLASAGTATQRTAGQSSVWEPAARTGSAPAVSGSTALGTTLASSAGQFLPGQTESTRRRTHGARRAVLAGGVLLIAALGIYATVTFRGRLTTGATSAAPDRSAGTRSTTPLLPILAPPDAARAIVAPPNAAPLPEAAHVTAVVAEEARPGKPKDKRPDKKGTKKHLAGSTPLPQELPPSLPKESPLPLPKEPPPPAPKKVERW
jgi:serine/threonine-protein kinase